MIESGTVLCLSFPVGLGGTIVGDADNARAERSCAKWGSMTTRDSSDFGDSASITWGIGFACDSV